MVHYGPSYSASNSNRYTLQFSPIIFSLNHKLLFLRNQHMNYSKLFNFQPLLCFHLTKFTMLYKDFLGNLLCLVFGKYLNPWVIPTKHCPFRSAIVIRATNFIYFLLRAFEINVAKTSSQSKMVLYPHTCLTLAIKVSYTNISKF